MNYHNNHKCEVSEPHVHPEDFGAVADGVTNDSPAIQRAIDKAIEMGGARVVLQPKEHRINEPLRMGSYSLGGGGTISGE